ncbi:unnamed protein product [Paramecium sonneborni]|uniref:Uncharacterized protein n=1 Tax=Paramecium sonneborni TaxID=65129 RepID=A0A8S1P6A6_9CILI|nr:unnamed protein product [Paramecium sonneborni]
MSGLEEEPTAQSDLMVNNMRAITRFIRHLIIYQFQSYLIHFALFCSFRDVYYSTLCQEVFQIFFLIKF